MSASHRLALARAFQEEEHELSNFEDLASSQPIPLFQLCTKAGSKRGGRSRKLLSEVSSGSDTRAPHSTRQQKALSRLSALHHSSTGGSHLNVDTEPFTPSRLDSQGWGSTDESQFKQNPLSYSRSYNSSYSYNTPLHGSVTEDTSLHLYGASFDRAYNQSPYESLRVRSRLKRPETRITSGLQLSGPKPHGEQHLERMPVQDLEKEEKRRKFKEEVTALLKSVAQEIKSPKPDKVPMHHQGPVMEAKAQPACKSQQPETKVASASTASNRDHDSAAHTEKVLRTPPGLTRPKGHIQQRLEDADAWFHRDGRGEDHLRQQIAGIAGNCRSSKEERTALLLGDIILNLYSYVSRDGAKKTGNFADFGRKLRWQIGPLNYGNGNTGVRGLICIE
ncbi:hypothetical protein BO71DRAFT_408464 [Aspergillus ellipticus CBS 707.79]|uniref:Uncharacterized protein n=1 Tax=Aspergillus ellipticus CBS 707.79 TaxID=1448320 RepID=A0A319DDX4_9EURO|nr:hypothetical protein BO71DRAFT_408464 [Aspergillus ellipticus CBS 707.79]